MWIKSFFEKRKQEKEKRWQEACIQQALQYFEKLKQEADASMESSEDGGIRRDFGKGFMFTKSKITDASSLLVLFSDENGGLNDLTQKRKRYSNQYFSLIMKLTCKVPTFDYGDREYDSQHNLVLFKCGDKAYAINYSNGYSMGSIYWLGRVTACPPEFSKKLGLIQPRGE